ncbi:MAG: hypothetical protein A2521_12230 [Deltaproteobacteria bacterium RIFOXYD12_FULL_57_12]|nr:MAG: hypothetical protein A2521_12230 [Deltaproteobacteria bacterium RIFOXYD12_FULL_57_12]
MNVKISPVLTAGLLLWGTAAFAAHPLITDDAGTLGKGNSQLEVNGQYDHDDEDGVREESSELALTLSYGLVDNADLVVGIPYQAIRSKEAGMTAAADGISDTSLEVKWKFYDQESMSLALKPGLTLPTGDKLKGLGAGKATYSVFLVATNEASRIACHMNLGYIRNENLTDERKNLWHASFATELKLSKDLVVVANIGLEQNPDPSSNTAPAFLLGGLIYSINESVDIDFGVKGGLSRPEPDYSLLAGMKVGF